MAQIRVRKWILTWLEEHGSLSTREIYDLFIDEKPSFAPTMYQLGNTLGKMPQIHQIGMHTSFKGYNRWLRHAVWQLKEEVV